MVVRYIIFVSKRCGFLPLFSLKGVIPRRSALDGHCYHDYCWEIQLAPLFHNWSLLEASVFIPLLKRPLYRYSDMGVLHFESYSRDKRDEVSIVIPLGEGTRLPVGGWRWVPAQHHVFERLMGCHETAGTAEACLLNLAGCYRAYHQVRTMHIHTIVANSGCNLVIYSILYTIHTYRYLEGSKLDCDLAIRPYSEMKCQIVYSVHFSLALITMRWWYHKPIYVGLCRVPQKLQRDRSDP